MPICWKLRFGWLRLKQAFDFDMIIYTITPPQFRKEELPICVENVYMEWSTDSRGADWRNQSERTWQIELVGPAAYPLSLRFLCCEVVEFIGVRTAKRPDVLRHHSPILNKTESGAIGNTATVYGWPGSYNSFIRDRLVWSSDSWVISWVISHISWIISIAPS